LQFALKVTFIFTMLVVYNKGQRAVINIDSEPFTGNWLTSAVT